MEHIIQGPKLTIKTLNVLEQSSDASVLYEISKSAFVALTEKSDVAHQAYKLSEVKNYRKLCLYRGCGYDDDSLFDEADKIPLWYGKDFVVYGEGA